MWLGLLCCCVQVVRPKQQRALFLVFICCPVGFGSLTKYSAWLARVAHECHCDGSWIMFGSKDPAKLWGLNQGTKRKGRFVFFLSGVSLCYSLLILSILLSDRWGGGDSPPQSVEEQDLCGLRNRGALLWDWSMSVKDDDCLALQWGTTWRELVFMTSFSLQLSF